MKTRALLLALPILVLASCKNDNRASVQIQSVCFPKKDCTEGGTCEAVATFRGKLDVSFPGHAYFLELQVANKMLDNADATTGKTNTNGAHIDGVSVEYTGIALPRLRYGGINQYVPANGTTVAVVLVVDPQNVNGAGQTTAALLDAAAATGDRPLTAKIRLHGYLDDGSRFETGEFPTSLDVCTGCVGVCPPDKFACPAAGMEPASCATNT